MLTKEDYMKLPKERLAELLAERDLPVTHVPLKLNARWRADQYEHPAKWSDTYYGFIDGAKWADAHPHWISVEDELPPKNEAFLAFWQFLGVTRYRFVKGGAKVSRTFSEHITHWMPLPEAPHHIIDANKKVDRIIGTADHIKTALDVLNKEGGAQ